MAHGYTPGLRVTGSALIHRERRLPLRGDVLAAVGDAVEPCTVVARTRLPGNVQTVNLAARLAVDPAKVPETLACPVGAAVRKGQPIATARGLFGLARHTVAAPADGTIESVSRVTGQLILREPPLPVEVCAYLRGVVTAVLPGEGVVVEARGALVQGIFGVGGEAWGELVAAVESPGDELTPYRLRPEHRGMVVVGGCHVSFDALARARELGVAAVVAGGFDDADLRRLLGRDLGVAVTGSEEIGLTLVLTEGFGRIRMAERTWELLAARQGRLASVSGATQIRAGVLRPEIIIPGGGEPAATHEESVAGLEVGSLLRVIREPWFGRIGKVVELPSELRRLDTEALVRVLVVRFVEGDAVAVVPRANVEIIAS
ncbi:MAG: hypothetical protein HZC42_01460 [Candidatus Eisenbacteria bacterium]|nr:hypothetical protein [Candidatus Eisenbacteria bacterium]